MIPASPNILSRYTTVVATTGFGALVIIHYLVVLLFFIFGFAATFGVATLLLDLSIVWAALLSVVIGVLFGVSGYFLFLIGLASL
ncbi:hypothetical protein CK500_00575 [Halorubrum salipaludis]|uniref:Uncharacterized protein n=1 Tax=Halorubrum salipaludis TaxID=2032630 RepID=A0A2A2FKV5_9EURY|nr:hypothetical protein [Halorubrum salipaludis]PAU85195.1 hypothetical protein CK500_00575 [Halorubrum salipaludis]